jgi:uncharacterized SAM-binding protein YcdF (DUF218 family)
MYPFDFISEFIFARTELNKADIILIPGGSHPQLMVKAVELYNNNLAPYILPSGGVNPKLPDHESEWEFLKEIAIKLGVPDYAILKENRASHTFENAELSRDVLNAMGKPIKSAILVCKAHHARRALLTYQFIFPNDVKFYVSPVVDSRGISKETWFLNKDHIKIVMSEVEKIGKYFSDKISKWVDINQ